MVHIKKGELTQEEKELLEVIGKGMGAGLLRRRCQSGLGAWRSPGGAPGPADPGLLFCEVGSLGPGISVSRFGLGPVAGAERWGGSGGCRGSSFNSAFGKVQVRAPIKTSDPRVWAPGCSIFGTPQVIFDHGLLATVA